MLRTLASSAVLPHALYRSAQIRHLEQLAQQHYGLTETTLMERAGLAAWITLRRCWPQARQLGVLCGSGNNGGDAYVLARWAQQAGYRVSLHATHPPCTPAAQAAAHAWEQAGGATLPVPTVLPRVDVWVDGVLGTGLSRPVTGNLARLITTLNTTATPVLALDVPSGLDADTGAARGPVVRAQATVSFIGLKQGLCTGDAPESVGTLYWHGLDLPARLYAAEILSAKRLTWTQCAVQLPLWPRTAHKGTRGRVLVLGGQPGMAGAVLLAGQAALRCGAGLVTVATHPGHAASLPVAQAELMVQGVDSAETLAPLLAWADVVVLGCGLGQTAWSQALWQAAWTAAKPLVLDADGLNLLAQTPSAAARTAPWILTPHPGEAARLLGWTTAQVQTDRYTAVQALQSHYGGVVVLKGAGTLMSAADQVPRVCSAGNPGMASGGMGDTLSGAIAGLWAQGLALTDFTALEAATLGVCLHAAAADRLAARCGVRGWLATEVCATFAEVLHALEP